MKPAHTDQTHLTHVLAGGDERNDLPSYVTVDAQQRQVIVSTWVPTDEERQAIADGANIELMVWGERTPPVALSTNTDTVISVIPG